MRWGVPKQKRHCAAYGGISHQVIIVQKHKDFVIDVGQVIYQHRTIVCAWTREVSSIRPICASPGQSVGAELLLAQKNLAGYRWFESISLQRGVSCEL